MHTLKDMGWRLLQVLSPLAILTLCVMSDPGVAINADASSENPSTPEPAKTCATPVNLDSSDGEACCQPGRVDSAKHILAQVAQFKLKATQSRVDIQKALDDATRLKAQAGKLGKLPPGSLDQYKTGLQEFASHADQYRTHLANLERQIGTCHANEQAFQAQLKEYSMHVNQFHIPDIPPPHICGRLNFEEGAASNIANGMRADMSRLAKSEQDLASAESRLSTSVASTIRQDQSVMQRSQNTEGERQLKAEYAQLKTEYEMLNIQHKALIGAGLKDPANLVRVSGRVVSKAK